MTDCLTGTQIRMGCLASDLVQTGACVNFIQIFRIFQAEGGPDESVWGSETERAPQGTSPPTTAASAPAAVRASAKGKPKKRKGKLEAHLYIAMELCDWGSVEDMLRVLEADVLSSASVDPGLALVKPFMFQMAVSLAVATAKLSMLHGDIKLLNFMLMRNSTTHLT